MTAVYLSEFADPKMGIVYLVLEQMWRRMEIDQLNAACSAIIARDIKEQAERESMRRKVGKRFFGYCNSQLLSVNRS